jgi:AcrR family transcriptional regulator
LQDEARQVEGSGNENEQTNGTPAALLQAGRQLFPARGYAGTSVRDVTRLAGANLGAITYHFGSKRALYHAVVASALAPLAERAEASAATGAPAVARLEAFVRAMFAFLRANPDLPQLILREIVEGLGPESAAAVPMGRVLGMLAAAIGEAQACGEVRAGDPFLLAVSVLSQPVHLTLVAVPGPASKQAQTLVAAAAGRSGGWGEEELVEHALRFVRTGLGATGAGEDS